MWLPDWPGRSIGGHVVQTHVQNGSSTLAGGTHAGSSTSPHTESKWMRVVALTGVVFAGALATNLIGNSTPSSTASAAKVAHYYLVHKNAVNARGLFSAIAVLF